MKSSVKREHIAESIFEVLSLYVIEQGYHNKVKELTPDKLKSVQASVEKLLTDLKLELD